MDRRLELIGEMTPAIWLHLACAVLALGLGLFVLWRRKGDGPHKLWGRVWVGLMVVTAVSSFWIREINEGGFSPIHALSVWTLYNLALGLYAIRNRARLEDGIGRHRRAMQALYIYGMLIAGGFTFLPHRLLGRLTFGETYPLINYAFVAGLALTGFVLLYRIYRPVR